MSAVDPRWHVTARSLSHSVDAAPATPNSLRATSSRRVPATSSSWARVRGTGRWWITRRTLPTRPGLHEKVDSGRPAPGWAPPQWRTDPV